MMHEPRNDWQALITSDPGYAAWMAADEEARIAAMEADYLARRYPYGQPEADTGYSWERADLCVA